jgi:hypothetical protein
MNIFWLIFTPLTVTAVIWEGRNIAVQHRRCPTYLGLTVAIVTCALLPALLARSAVGLSGRDTPAAVSVLAKAEVFVAATWYLLAWLWPNALFQMRGDEP